MEKSTKIWVTIIVIIVLLVLAFSIYRYTGAVTKQSNECYDSDGGQNLGVKGTVRNYKGFVKTDECQSPDRLVEYFCGPTHDIEKTEVVCECRNAICLQ